MQELERLLFEGVVGINHCKTGTNRSQQIHDGASRSSKKKPAVGYGRVVYFPREAWATPLRHGPQPSERAGAGTGEGVVLAKRVAFSSSSALSAHFSDPRHLSKGLFQRTTTSRDRQEAVALNEPKRRFLTVTTHVIRPVEKGLELSAFGTKDGLVRSIMSWWQDT
jgi:hypothetical protein